MVADRIFKILNITESRSQGGAKQEQLIKRLSKEQREPLKTASHPEEPGELFLTLLGPLGAQR